jgi:hypothetical protein
VLGKKAKREMLTKIVESVAAKPSLFAQRQLEKFGWREYVCPTPHTHPTPHTPRTT